MEHDRKNVDRFWQNAQTRGDVLQQQLDQFVQEREALAKSYRETIDDRDALLRIINDAFLSLHIPGSTKAFDGRNLVVHAQDSAEVAMVLRTERDEARRERDAALANTSLPGYVRLVEERDAAREACERKHQDGWAWAQLAQQREAELDAARAEAEKLRIESQANADTLVDWRRKAEFLLQEREQGVAARETLDDVCKVLGADVDSAVPQALMFKEKAGEAEKLRAELDAVKRQRDELLASSEPVADALRDIAGDGHRAYLDAYESAVASILAASQPAQQPKPEGGVS